MGKALLLLFIFSLVTNVFCQTPCDYKVIALNKFDGTATYRIHSYSIINIPVKLFDKVRKRVDLFRSADGIRGDMVGLEANIIPFCQIKDYKLTEVKVEQDSVYPNTLNVRLVYSQTLIKK